MQQASEGSSLIKVTPNPARKERAEVGGSSGNLEVAASGIVGVGTWVSSAGLFLASLPVLLEARLWIDRAKAYIALGIVGALVGGFLFDLFGASGVTGLNIYSMIVAIVGSIVVLLIYNALTGHRRA
jgi:hypothetical protein